MEILTVNSNKGTLTVKWSDQDKLAHYAAMQSGLYFDDVSNIDWSSPKRFTPIHNLNFHKWYQERWLEKENLSVFDLPDGAKIIDIGCGMAISDLLLYSYIPNSVFYLVDKEAEWPLGLSPKDVSYTKDHPHYTSWGPIHDAIETTNFDPRRFNILSTADDFPKAVDLIMSSFSYCYHYPKEIYWRRIQNSLKVGGKLFLDVRLLKDRDVVGEISEEFKSKPKFIKIPLLPNYLDNVPQVDPETTGYSCLWVRNA
jgi:SAM-dependent methyltransferase